MTPLIITAIRAAQRALEEMRRHEHQRSSLSSERPQTHGQTEHPRTAPVHPSLLRRFIRWFSERKNG